MERISALIVDTNEAILFLYKDLIESRNPRFDCFFVDSIEKTKKLIELRKFSILAINYKLSNFDCETGVTIAADFRNKNPDAPVVILTSLVNDAKEEAKKIGITERILFIRKPISFDELSIELEDFLGVVPW